MPPLTLTGLYIYPIKSAAGIAVDSAQVEARGFQGDRRWLLVNEANRFMTQRQFPKMALITVRIKPKGLTVEAPGMSPLQIPHLPALPPLERELVRVQIWRDICQAIPLGPESQQWFSEFLQVPCQLVYMPDQSDRPVRDYPPNPQQQVSFADSFPFLLISEASLQDLNDRLEESIPMNRFRPNLVVAGCEAFAEDRWQLIQIGKIPFRVVKACSRCKVPTIDQATGLAGLEPLRTLAQYRLWDGEIWFGQNLVPQQQGTLQMGDTVQILE